MPARVIDGKAIAADIRRRVAEEAGALRRAGRPACLASVHIGDDPSAMSYSSSQARHAEAVGIDFRAVRLPASASRESAVEVIQALNADAAVTGILLHLPVPPPLDAGALQQLIAPEKDVEAVGPASLGLLATGRSSLAPCTAAAAFECIRSAAGDAAGREVVIVGRSAIVGRPLSWLLLAAHATVTICHTRTRNLADHTRRAEILVAAAGSPGLIGREHVAPGAIVIDVGTNRVDAGGGGRMVGDVRYDEVAAVASAITPVPGGVGPVTVAMLLANVVAAARGNV